MSKKIICTKNRLEVFRDILLNGRGLLAETLSGEQTNAILSEFDALFPGLAAVPVEVQTGITLTNEEAEAVEVAIESFIAIGSEYYDMDCGPNGSACLASARGALELLADKRSAASTGKEVA